MTPAIYFSDQELMKSLQESDHSAFTELYKRYWEKMLFIAWNHTKDMVAAEDVVHEVFMSLWEEKNNLDIQNVGGFLATKIKFTIFNKYRKEQRRLKLAELNCTFSVVTMDEEKLDALFLEEYINGIIEHLPEKCRLTFKYSRQAGMKNAEIASHMNISEKGVEANLTRALKIIRNKLELTGMSLLLFQELIKIHHHI